MCCLHHLTERHNTVVDSGVASSPVHVTTAQKVGSPARATKPASGRSRTGENKLQLFRGTGASSSGRSHRGSWGETRPCSPKGNPARQHPGDIIKGRGLAGLHPPRCLLCWARGALSAGSRNPGLPSKPVAAAPAPQRQSGCEDGEGCSMRAVRASHLFRARRQRATQRGVAKLWPESKTLR